MPSSPDPASGRPLRADAARNRAKVLAAAAEVFAEHGLDAPIPMIARRAGVGYGTVYRQFPAKRDLVAALVAERLAWLEREAVASLEVPDPWEGLSGYLRKVAALLADDRAFGQAFRQALRRPEIQSARDRAIAALAALLGRAQASGAARPDVVVEDLPVLLAGLSSATAGADATSGMWERHLGIVLDGLRAEGAHPLPSR